MSRRTVRRLLLVSLAVPVAAIGLMGRRSAVWTPTLGDAVHITAVAVWLGEWGDGDDRTQPQLLARSTDPAAIRALLAALTTTGEASPHKCGDRGWFLFVRSDGRRATVPYLPGHHPDSYEVRPPGAWVRVPRAELLAGVKGAGADRFPLDCQKPPEPIP